MKKKPVLKSCLRHCHLRSKAASPRAAGAAQAHPAGPASSTTCFSPQGVRWVVRQLREHVGIVRGTLHVESTCTRLLAVVVPRARDGEGGVCKEADEGSVSKPRAALRVSTASRAGPWRCSRHAKHCIGPKVRTSAHRRACHKDVTAAPLWWARLSIYTAQVPFAGASKADFQRG